MKRTKLFIGLGAFTLALGSFFVTKANNKKATPVNGHFIGSAEIASNLTSYTANFTTAAMNGLNSNHLVFIAKTAGSSTSFTPLATLYTASNATNPVYHK